MSPSAYMRMDIIRRVVESRAPKSLIEVGPGMGAMAWHLSQVVTTYRGYEPDIDAFRAARDRLSDRPGATLENDFLPSEPVEEYDGLVAFEVLEHIERDLAALSSWVRWVRPGGFVLLSVPAKRSRYGEWDRAVGHYRRYDKGDLEGVMDGAGLIDVYLRMFGMPLGYLLEGLRQAVMSRQLSPEKDFDARTGRSGRSFQPRTSGTLIKALTYPFIVAQRPFEKSSWGIGWVAVGRRPS